MKYLEKWHLGQHWCGGASVVWIRVQTLLFVWLEGKTMREPPFLEQLCNGRKALTLTNLVQMCKQHALRIAWTIARSIAFLDFRVLRWKFTYDWKCVNTTYRVPLFMPTACFPEGPSPPFTFCSFWRRRQRLEAVIMIVHTFKNVRLPFCAHLINIFSFLTGVKLKTFFLSKCVWGVWFVY